MTLGSEEGFVRVTARADNHLVLGIQAIGSGVSELSAAFGLALDEALIALRLPDWACNQAQDPGCCSSRVLQGAGQTHTLASPRRGFLFNGVERRKFSGEKRGWLVYPWQSWNGAYGICWNLPSKGSGSSEMA